MSWAFPVSSAGRSAPLALRGPVPGGEGASVRGGPHTRQAGAETAAILAGAWRPKPPPLREGPIALEALVPLLIDTGGAGLAWWRLRDSGVATTPACHDLLQCYRLYTLHAALQEQRLQELVPSLRAAGVEPLLVKGWSLARLYPVAGLRPTGDVDLCVAPDHLPQAIAALTRLDGAYGWVDLHRGLGDLPDRTWDQAYARSRLIPLGEVAVRILGAEDQLRQVCLHLLRHGAYRPLWLCDVAVLLESLPRDFDWDYCLHGARRRTAWALAVLGLACRLLGARTDCPAVLHSAGRPTWLDAAVLHQWGLGAGSIHYTATATFLDRPGGLWRALCDRWLNLNWVETVFNTGLPPLSALPPSVIRPLAFVARGLRYAASLVVPYQRRPKAIGQSFDLHPGA